MLLQLSKLFHPLSLTFHTTLHISHNCHSLHKFTLLIVVYHATSEAIQFNFFHFNIKYGLNCFEIDWQYLSPILTRKKPLITKY